MKVQTVQFQIQTEYDTIDPLSLEQLWTSWIPTAWETKGSAGALNYSIEVKLTKVHPDKSVHIPVHEYLQLARLYVSTSNNYRR